MKIFLKSLLLSMLLVIACAVKFQAQDGPAALRFKSSGNDPVTGEDFRITVTNRIGINSTNDTLAAYFQRRSTKGTETGFKYYLHIFPYSDLGCSGISENYAKIKLVTGEVINLDKDISEIDCERPAESIYEISGEKLEKLSTNKIESIKLRQSKYYADFSVWYPDLFYKSIRLLNH